MFKPPTQGSISGLLLAEAFAEAGLPAGVFNTITGRGSEIGDYIIEHPEVNFINFTGSTPIGQKVGKLAGIRPIMLELGGKDAAVVLEDADLDHAAKKLLAVPIATLVNAVQPSSASWSSMLSQISWQLNYRQKLRN